MSHVFAASAGVNFSRYVALATLGGASPATINSELYNDRGESPTPSHPSTGIYRFTFAAGIDTAKALIYINGIGMFDGVRTKISVSGTEYRVSASVTATYVQFSVQNTSNVHTDATFQIVIDLTEWQ